MKSEGYSGSVVNPTESILWKPFSLISLNHIQFSLIYIQLFL